MIEIIGRAIVAAVLWFFWRIILYPAALVLFTPLILIRAAVLAFRRQQKFRYAAADGYAYLSDVWWASW